jgi:hypothetical protein
MSTYSRLLWAGIIALAIAMAAFLIPGAAKPVLAAYAPVLIDHFDNSSSLSISVPGTISGTTTGTAAQIIGTERDVVLTDIDTGNVQANSNAPASRFTLNPDSGVRGRVSLTYDGPDGNPNLLSFGLNANLIPNNEQAFVIGAMEIDWPSVFTVTLYTTDATNCSYLRINTPAQNPNMPPIAISFLYASFLKCPSASAKATLTDVDAIVVDVDGTGTAGTDIILEFMESTKFDFGDLPAGYLITTLANYNGLGGVAAHAKDADLFLGTEWDAEPDGQPSANARGDDNNGTPDDEDGVSWSGEKITDWHTPTKIVTVTVHVVGDGCLGGWIDWANDGSFGVYGDEDWVIVNSTVSTGNYTYSFTVPADVSQPPTLLNARFRLFPRNAQGVCPDAGNGFILSPYTQKGTAPYNPFASAGGEVEDYQLGADTTAVKLESFVAHMDQPDLFASLAFIGFVGVVGAAGLYLKRRR